MIIYFKKDVNDSALYYFLPSFRILYLLLCKCVLFVCKAGVKLKKLVLKNVLKQLVQFSAPRLQVGKLEIPHDT